MCAGLSVRIGNIMCFPHGRESRNNQLGISRKGIFLLLLWGFFCHWFPLSGNYFWATAWFYVQFNFSQCVLDFAGTSKVIILSQGLFSHVWFLMYLSSVQVIFVLVFFLLWTIIVYFFSVFLMKRSPSEVQRNLYSNEIKKNYFMMCSCSSMES